MATDSDEAPSSARESVQEQSLENGQASPGRRSVSFHQGVERPPLPPTPPNPPPAPAPALTGSSWFRPSPSPAPAASPQGAQGTWFRPSPSPTSPAPAASTSQATPPAPFSGGWFRRGTESTSTSIPVPPLRPSLQERRPSLSSPVRHNSVLQPIASHNFLKADVMSNTAGHLSHRTIQRQPSVAPTEAPEAKEYKKGEIPAANLITHLIKTVRRSRQRTELLVHLVLILILCIMLLLSKVESNMSRPFFVYDAVKDLSLGTAPPAGMLERFPSFFEDISSEDQLWGWLDGFVDRLWYTGGGTTQSHADLVEFLRVQNVPLAYVILYQQRLRTEECTLRESHLLSPHAISLLPNTCSPFFDGASHALDTAPFGSNGQWKSSKEIKEEGNEAPRLSGPVHAEIYSYHSGDNLYPIILNISHPVSAIKMQLEDLKNGTWIDNRTRVVGLDFFTFNRYVRYFVRCQVFVEITIGGQIRPQYDFLPFSLQSSTLETPKDYVVLTLDIIILILIAFEAVDLVITLRSNAELEGDWKRAVSLWEMVNIINVALFIVNYYYKFKLLAAASESREHVSGSGNLDLAMYSALSTFAEDYDKNILFQAWNVALSWVRLFQYLQYNERLNVLSETVKQAAGELIAMACISTILLMAYAFMGHLLFGPSVGAFRDFSRSWGTLLRFVYGEAWDEYPEMVHAHRTISGLYVVSFLIIIWLILLNLVLAIITGSFAVVQESLADPDWSLESLLRDARTFFRRVGRYWAKRWSKQDRLRASGDSCPSLHDLDAKEVESEDGNLNETHRTVGLTSGHGTTPPASPRGGSPKITFANEEKEKDVVEEEEESASKVSSAVALKVIRILRHALHNDKEKWSNEHQYLTPDELRTMACFLTEEQTNEICRLARLEFTGRQQMVKMGERLAQHMSQRLIAIEQLVMRLVMLEPYIQTYIPAIETRVSAGFEEIDRGLVPNVHNIDRNVSQLQEVPVGLKEITREIDNVMSSAVAVQQALSTLKEEIGDTLNKQSSRFDVIDGQLSLLSGLPEAQEAMLAHLRSADEQYRRTTEQLLVPLKAGLTELSHQQKIKTGLSLSSARAEQREKQEQAERETSEFKQYFEDMVGQLVGGSGEKSPTEATAPKSSSKSRARAVAQVIAKETSEPSKRPDMYDPRVGSSKRHRNSSP